METKQGYFDPKMPRALDDRHYKATVNDILAIPVGARYEGLEIYAYDEDVWYIFKDGVEDINLEISLRDGSPGPELNAWYVNVNGDDDDGDGSPQEPFATPQKAIDEASPLDIIYLSNGTFAQSLLIDKHLTFVGAGSGKDEDILTLIAHDNIIIDNSAADVTVRFSKCGIDLAVTLGESVITNNSTYIFNDCAVETAISTCGTFIATDTKLDGAFTARLNSRLRDVEQETGSFTQNAGTADVANSSILVAMDITGDMNQYNSVITPEPTVSGVRTIKNQHANTLPYDNSTSGLAATDVQAAIDEVAAAAGTHNYGRVFWVSSQVAVDYVGTVGDFTDPFGIEALAGEMDTQYDTAIIMPGTYTFANQIQNAVSNLNYYLMAGVIFDFNGTTRIWNASNPCRILGYGHYIVRNSGAIAVEPIIFEFDKIEWYTSSELVVGFSELLRIKGNEIIIRAGGAIMELPGELDVGVLNCQESTAYFKLEYMGESGNNKIGKVISNSTVAGLYVSNVDGSQIKLDVGHIEVSAGHGMTLNSRINAQYHHLTVDTIDISASGKYGIHQIGRYCKLDIQYIKARSGATALYVTEGSEYKVGHIDVAGGGYGIYTINNYIDSKVFVFNLNASDAHAIYMQLQQDLATLSRPKIYVHKCKQNTTLYRCVYITQPANDSPVQQIEIGGYFEAPEIPIQFNLKGAWQDDALHILLQDCVLYSVDQSQCMTTNLADTRVMCRNAWANVGAGSMFKLTMEGLNVSDEITQ